MNRVSCLLLLSLVLCAVRPTHAWWRAGHAHITWNAVRHLPDPLRSCFLTNQDCLAELSSIEPPGAHYINIDNYAEFLAGEFPRDVNVLIDRYGAATVDRNGRAPWTAADYIDQLSGRMASAESADDWSALLLTAAELAHYLGDLHNPLHLTRNFDGQFTGNFGIHARYEGEMIYRHLDSLTIPPAPSNCVHWEEPVDAILDGIEAHYPHIEAILAADNASRGSGHVYDEAYYDELWRRTSVFTQDLFEAGSYAVASAWFTAWVNAGRPTPRCISTRGDFDGGGAGISDVGPFVEALLQPTPQAECAADLNSDGRINGRDVSLFVRLLQN